MRSGTDMRRRSLVVGVVFAGVATAAASVYADDPRLDLRAVKAALFVGEPAVISLGIETMRPVEIPGKLIWESAPLKILIDRGSGFVPYVEGTWASEWREPRKQALKGGKARIEYVLSYDAKIDRWVFPQPGSYRVVAEYRDDLLPATRSNTVTFTVSAPTGDEKTVRDAILKWGERSLGLHEPSRIGVQGKDLLQRSPASVYLQELRLNDLRARVSSISNGSNPDEPHAAGSDENPPPAPNFRPDVQRTWLNALLPDARDAADTAGPFQADALVLLAGVYESLGDDATAQTLYARVVREFPDRTAAQAARERVADATPPELTIVASPRTLWPPNHRMESIAVSVQVKDDSDPGPAVKLVSVTCDDGCDPTQDIAGAEFGTDDHDFSLRATRGGSGVGRTYTITYSAMDVSGNTATKATTVTVPHDQGR